MHARTPSAAGSTGGSRRTPFGADARRGGPHAARRGGTQARATMSSVFLDLAIEAGVDVVPVRFVGGLPMAPSADRIAIDASLEHHDVEPS